MKPWLSETKMTLNMWIELRNEILALIKKNNIYFTLIDEIDINNIPNISDFYKEIIKDDIEELKNGNESAFCYTEFSFIALDREHYEKPDFIGMFALLHELGHIFTNDDNDLLWKQEYKATEWAINYIKDRCVYIPYKIRYMYEDYVKMYINQFIDNGQITEWPFNNRRKFIFNWF